MTDPIVSVILPVYYGERYLRESVDSILNQTFRDFEFIIFDDGSKDGSCKILESYDDPRIRLIFQENAGLPETLNRAIALCKGRYIARQDHDDISLPARLQKQFEFLEENPQYAMVGTGAAIWSEEESSNRQHDHPSDCLSLRFELLFNNPFVHSSLMFRQEVFKEIGLYSTDPNRQPPEDYELISRIARRYPIANLSEHLVIYRETANSMSSVIRPDALEKNNSFKAKLALISAENLEYEWHHEVVPSKTALTFGKVVHSCRQALGSTDSSFFDILKSLSCAFSHIFGGSPKQDSMDLLSMRIRKTYIEYCLYNHPTLFDKSKKGIYEHIKKQLQHIIYKLRIRIMPFIYDLLAKHLLLRMASKLSQK